MPTRALELRKVTKGAGINPSYVVGTESVLYAVNECNEASALRPGHETGFGTAYKMKEQGDVVRLSLHETCGTYACHVALSPQRDFVSVANYGGGLSLFPVKTDGSLAPASDYHCFPGASLVVPDRQDASHIHSTAWTS
ncbi:hypothetical protein PsorP6_001254 [Peronosclerospora sorghi]|uniref:Uncharacterized protein n=1 Tax=Peronosclerospora sorghi TaxID=230839 RepID=A0ACC0WT12_9STRA|nr:hypothetical protein PsorP6_001254 [Peronosclerospora sorghi]